MPHVRLVLDTNILIGALITKGTPPDELYRAWLRGDIELVTSAAQIAELAEVLARPRIRRLVDADEANAILENLAVRALVLNDLPAVDFSPDPSDNPILAAAIAGNADFVVSGDKKHVLSLGEVDGIPVVTARDALKGLSLSVGLKRP